MIPKALFICLTVILALLAPRVYQHFRHQWGYDDSTVIHQTGGTSYSIPQEIPTTPQ